MASYTYTGDVVLEFPTLVLTVKPGDTFDAPDGFVAANVAPATGKKAAPAAAPVTPIPSSPSASSDSTAGA
jgi:hypothetical protein